MTKPLPVLDHINDTLRLLPRQFQGGPVIETILKSYANQIQILENVFIEVWWARSIDEATNAALDNIGKILTEPRRDATDEAYRARLKTRIRIFRSFGRMEDILEVLRSAASLDYHIQELQPASLLIEIVNHNVSIGLVLLDLVKKARAAGVEISLVYHPTNSDRALLLADSDATTTDMIHGLSDDSEVTGGYLATYER